jgi:hypothetical protein
MTPKIEMSRKKFQTSRGSPFLQYLERNQDVTLRILQGGPGHPLVEPKIGHSLFFQTVGELLVRQASIMIKAMGWRKSPF